MISAASVLLALFLDKLLGEPARFHPLLGFGYLAKMVEQKLYSHSKFRGVIAIVILLTPFIGLVMLLDLLPGSWVLSVGLLYLAIGWQSLTQHAELVRQALMRKDITLARERVSHLVSRDTKTLDMQGVARGTVESVLENGNDAVFAAIFWFMVAGAPGVVAYRLVNTLDAMWGYRNARYNEFGWAAARLDDVLNYVPARLTALSYALAGKSTQALRCWSAQGAIWKSPNAGPVMAAGAGSIGVVVGGPEVYKGVPQSRIALGQGRAPDAQAIAESQQLISRALLIWLAVILLGGAVFEYFHQVGLTL